MTTVSSEPINRPDSIEQRSVATRRSTDRASIREHTIETYAASDGYLLHLRRWKPDVEPLAHVVALHGVQSHSGWYTYSTSRLAAAGYDVHFLDRRGSGLNGEQRGNAPHHDRLINDVCQYLTAIRHAERTSGGHRPVILLGVSWAGRLTSMLASRRPDLLDGVAMLYPGIHARIRPSRWQMLKLHLAVSQGYGWVSVPIPLTDTALFTGDPAWQEFIRHDPLALHKATLSFLIACRNLDELAIHEGTQLKCPLLMMLAGQDRIIDNPRVKAFFHQVASGDKWLLEYPNAQHTLEFEPNRDCFIDDLLDWLTHVVNVHRAGW
ncbi:MAG: alpha/beta fold hydrolase [Planctomycetota bacterium]|nr:alpha/beta fold hydrolase [Planctomycetota bacterium]